MSLPHPDFEPYDSIGRTTEQITAHREDRPTADDLHRWAAHDARQFTALLPSEDAGQSISDWTRQLYRVRTAAELNTVTQAVLGDGHSGLAELHLFLETAAEWCERNQEPSIAARYRQHAEQLSELGDQLAYVSEDYLSSIYRRTRQVRAAVPGGPAALSAPSPRMLTARPAPPPAHRASTAHCRPFAERGSPLSDHFRFGAHPDHGFVAAATANIPAHLAEWFLVRGQFEPVPGTAGLYRLTNPEQDGIRRTRQAVHDLRRHVYEVQADYSLDPGRSASPPQPTVRNGLTERRNHIAQAAATRSSQQRAAPTTPLPEVHPQPDAVPVGGSAQTAGKRRSR